MKANELRIGNLLYNDGVVVTIDARSIFDIWDDNGLGKYKPITLTPEWLERFGFESYLNSEYKKDCLYIEILNDGTIEWCWGWNNEKSDPINYVHQLQNLYFALTGAELSLKR